MKRQEHGEFFAIYCSCVFCSKSYSIHIPKINKWSNYSNILKPKPTRHQEKLYFFTILETLCPWNLLLFPF